MLSSRSGSLVRRISILSFFAIFVSVSAFLIVLFVMNGMNQGIQSRIKALDPHLSAYFKNGEQIDLPDRPSSKAIKFTNYDLIIRTADGQFKGTQATGYSADSLNFWFDSLARLKKKEKKDFFFDEVETSIDLGRNEIAVGIDLARSLGLLEGDEVSLIPIETLLMSDTESPIIEKVIVKKIFATDLADLDANLLFFNLTDSLKTFEKSLSKMSGYHFWLDDANNSEQWATDLRQKPFARVTTWKENNSELFFALFMEKTMIGVILALAGLIASTSILTVLALMMSQKRRDIAIMKTLGFSKKQTVWLFTKMGLWISMAGIVLGFVVGLGVSYYLQYYPLNILPQIYYDASIPAAVNLPFAIVVFCVCVILAMLGCYVPARATLAIEPAILLKQKH